MLQNMTGPHRLALQNRLRLFGFNNCQGLFVMILFDLIFGFGIDKDTDRRPLSFTPAKIIMKKDLIAFSVFHFQQIHTATFKKVMEW